MPPAPYDRVVTGPRDDKAVTSGRDGPRLEMEIGDGPNPIAPVVMLDRESRVAEWVAVNAHIAAVSFSLNSRVYQCNTGSRDSGR